MRNRRTNIVESKTNTGKVSMALSKVQMEMGLFVVDKEGYNFKYLTLAKMLEVILPVSGKHNLSIMQFPSIEAVDGQPWVTIVTRLSCEDEWIENEFQFLLIEPTKKNDTEIMCAGSTVSYLRRFALQSILGIAGADKDAEDIQSRDISDSSSAPKLK